MPTVRNGPSGEGQTPHGDSEQPPERSARGGFRHVPQPRPAACPAAFWPREGPTVPCVWKQSGRPGGPRELLGRRTRVGGGLGPGGATEQS